MPTLSKQYRSKIARFVNDGSITTPQKDDLVAYMLHNPGKSLREATIDLRLMTSLTYDTFQLVHKLQATPKYKLKLWDSSPSYFQKILPRDIAEKYKVVPLAAFGDTLTVITENPIDSQAIAELKRVTGKKIKIYSPRGGFNFSEHIELLYDDKSPIRRRQKFN